MSKPKQKKKLNYLLHIEQGKKCIDIKIKGNEKLETLHILALSATMTSKRLCEDYREMIIKEGRKLGINLNDIEANRVIQIILEDLFETSKVKLLEKNDIKMYIDKVKTMDVLDYEEFKKKTFG